MKSLRVNLLARMCVYMCNQISVCILINGISVHMYSDRMHGALEIREKGLLQHTVVACRCRGFYYGGIRVSEDFLRLLILFWGGIEINCSSSKSLGLKGKSHCGYYYPGR